VAAAAAVPQEERAEVPAIDEGKINFSVTKS